MDKINFIFGHIYTDALCIGVKIMSFGERFFIKTTFIFFFLGTVVLFWPESIEKLHSYSKEFFNKVSGSQMARNVEQRMELDVILNHAKKKVKNQSDDTSPFKYFQNQFNLIQEKRLLSFEKKIEEKTKYLFSFIKEIQKKIMGI